MSDLRTISIVVSIKCWIILLESMAWSPHGVYNCSWNRDAFKRSDKSSSYIFAGAVGDATLHAFSFFCWTLIWFVVYCTISFSLRFFCCLCLRFGQVFGLFFVGINALWNLRWHLCLLRFLLQFPFFFVLIKAARSQTILIKFSGSHISFVHQFTHFKCFNFARESYLTRIVVLTFQRTAILIEWYALIYTEALKKMGLPIQLAMNLILFEIFSINKINKKNII